MKASNLRIFPKMNLTVNNMFYPMFTRKARANENTILFLKAYKLDTPDNLHAIQTYLDKVPQVTNSYESHRATDAYLDQARQIAYALQYLNTADIYTEENRKAILDIMIDRSLTRVSSILYHLGSTHILNQENFDLLVRNADYIKPIEQLCECLSGITDNEMVPESSCVVQNSLVRLPGHICLSILEFGEYAEEILRHMPFPGRFPRIAPVPYDKVLANKNAFIKWKNLRLLTESMVLQDSLINLLFGQRPCSRISNHPLGEKNLLKKIF